MARRARPCPAVLGLRLAGQPGAGALGAGPSFACRGPPRAGLRRGVGPRRDRLCHGRRASVEAAEIDPMAAEAIRLNAALNGVTVEAVARDVVGEACRWDVVMCGDVCYEAPMTAHIMPWLRRLAASAEVFLADPGAGVSAARGPVRTGPPRRADHPRAGRPRGAHRAAVPGVLVPPRRADARSAIRPFCRRDRRIALRASALRRCPFSGITDQDAAARVRGHAEPGL